MAQITRWNPLREMAAMQNALDRLFDENWRNWPSVANAGENLLALDVHETDNGYEITTALPGVKADDINIRLHNDFLTIEGEIRQEKTQEGNAKRPLLQERVYGRFSRTLRLPQPIDRNNVDAQFEDGILKLTLPKSAEAQPHTIQVKSNKPSNN